MTFRFPKMIPDPQVRIDLRSPEEIARDNPPEYNLMALMDKCFAEVEAEQAAWAEEKRLRNLLHGEETARISAKDAARADALGLSWAATVWSDRTDVASRIADEAYDEESDERDLVDEAAQEDGMLDDEDWPDDGWS